jgi:hypothetical protein
MRRPCLHRATRLVVTRFKWHTLDKRERDPGWADERPEKDGPVIGPASPFKTSRHGRLRKKGSRIVWADGQDANSAASPTKKRSGKKSRKRKSGATTPFDRFSLAVQTLCRRSPRRPRSESRRGVRRSWRRRRRKGGDCPQRPERRPRPLAHGRRLSAVNARLRPRGREHHDSTEPSRRSPVPRTDRRASPSPLRSGYPG